MAVRAIGFVECDRAQLLEGRAGIVGRIHAQTARLAPRRAAQERILGAATTDRGQRPPWKRQRNERPSIAKTKPGECDGVGMC